MAARKGFVVMLSGTPQGGIGSRPLVAGVDEAGRGPLAGPVVAAAVILCKPCPAGLADSKVLTASARAKLEATIRARCVFGIAVVDVETIDRLNIFGATMLAMTQAVARAEAALGQSIEEALIDGNLTPQGRAPGWRWPARAIVKGDAKERCISAASILAKEYRDRIMREAALTHPQYGWERNMGYGTREHVEALRTYGATPHHRRSFAPVAQLEMFA
jgi:ribonuclease HII